MVMEREGIFEFRGQPVTVIGPDLRAGDIAPDFRTHTPEWGSMQALTETGGKVRIIGSLPSLTTSVCDRETRRLNEEASALGEDIVVIMVSMDLPYTQKNWCASAGVERVITLSDHKEAEFGAKYGVLLKELRIFRRAIFVVDRNEKVVYAAYLASLGDEPEYEAVLAAARSAL